MTMNWLGDIFLRYKGFGITSVIFLIINRTSIFIIYFFGFDKFNINIGEDEDKNDSYLEKTFYLFGCYILFLLE